VADITAGGRLLGKQGPWTVAALGARSEPLETGERATYAVARIQRAVGRSNVASTLASRRLNGVDEGSASVDTTWFFSRTFGVTAQAANAFGRFNDGTWAYFIRPSYDSSTAHAHIRYTHLGDRFGDNVNAIGLVADDNRRELDAAVAKTLWNTRRSITTPTTTRTGARTGGSGAGRWTKSSTSSFAIAGV
jgi:hypothetical protein